MRNTTRQLLRAAFAGAGWLAMAAGHAQSNAAPAQPASAQNDGPQAGDPARWYVEDKTSAEQLRTLRKEIGAALQEALAACNSAAASDRPACVAAARATYKQDMANASQQAAAAHPR